LPATLRLARFLPRSRVEGPGERAVLWTQGCPLRCPGCAQPSTWDFQGGYAASVAELVERILAEENLEGVTLLGGEPFLQAAPLVELLRPLRHAGLSVFTFSGYTWEQLRAAQRSDWDALLAHTDLLADGPYLQEEQDFSRPWVGSRNQRFHALGPRYATLPERLGEYRNGIELEIAPDGKVLANGMFPPGTLERLLDARQDLRL